MINFNLNQKKAIEAIVYLASKKPGMTQYYFMKMMFFADKLHLNKYARPIIGDRYIKMEFGPVPSFVLDVIHKNGDRLTHDVYMKVTDSLKFEPDGARIKTYPMRKPNLDYLSESDIECLDAAFDKCKDMKFAQLVKETHDEPAWKEAKDNCLMDYSLFLDKDNPDREFIIEDLSDWSETLVL
jgi:uncharacterized phage-associated protein